MVHVKAISQFERARFEILLQKAKIPKFSFVSRLNTLFCVQLFRFDSSIKPIIQSAEVHARNTQTNAKKLSCVVGAISHTKSVLLTITKVLTSNGERERRTSFELEVRQGRLEKFSGSEGK